MKVGLTVNTTLVGAGEVVGDKLGDGESKVGVVGVGEALTKGGVGVADDSSVVAEFSGGADGENKDKPITIPKLRIRATAMIISKGEYPAR